MNQQRTFHLVVLAGVLLAPVGCSRRQETTGSTPLSVESADEGVDPAHRQRAIQAKDALFAKLSGRLMEVMGSEGPAAAIEVCSREAGEIAGQVAAQHNVAIGRTAVRLRNRDNTPPPWAASLIKNMPAEPEFINLPDGHTGALLPIKLKAVCIVCHGDPDLIADDVKTQLNRLYPNDKATGFKEGDLRGWFWVDVPSST